MPSTIRPSMTVTYSGLDGPPETFTGVRLSGAGAAAEVFFFLRDLDLGMSGPSLCCAESSAAAACGSADAGRSHANLAGPTRVVARGAGSAPIGGGGAAAAEAGAMAPEAGRSLRPRWGLAVPLVPLVMGLLLAMTYASSQGRELRTSDSARMSDLVRDAQRGVE